MSDKNEQEIKEILERYCVALTFTPDCIKGISENDFQSVVADLLQSSERMTKEEIDKIVEENFKGLRDCIDDKGLAEWYIDVIKTMMEHYLIDE